MLMPSSKQAVVERERERHVAAIQIDFAVDVDAAEPDAVAGHVLRGGRFGAEPGEAIGLERRAVGPGGWFFGVERRVGRRAEIGPFVGGDGGEELGVGFGELGAELVAGQPHERRFVGPDAGQLFFRLRRAVGGLRRALADVGGRLLRVRGGSLGDSFAELGRRQSAATRKSAEQLRAQACRSVRSWRGPSRGLGGAKSLAISRRRANGSSMTL